jgi:hypothetical protein
MSLEIDKNTSLVNNTMKLLVPWKMASLSEQMINYQILKITYGPRRDRVRQV